MHTWEGLLALMSLFELGQSRQQALLQGSKGLHRATIVRAQALRNELPRSHLQSPVQRLS